MSFVIKLLGAVMFRILTRLMMGLLMLGALSFGLRYVPGMQEKIPDIGTVLAQYRVMLSDPGALDYGYAPTGSPSTSQAGDAMAQAQALLLGSGAGPSERMSGPSDMIPSVGGQGDAMAGIMKMIAGFTTAIPAQGAGAQQHPAKPLPAVDSGGVSQLLTSEGRQTMTPAIPQVALTELQKLRMRNFAAQGLGDTVPAKPAHRMKTVTPAR